MLIQADARSIPLRDGCVQCVVTSPPYFGLRDYGSVHQIGLEGAPDAYIAVLVAVFVEVWRVLADDGVCWLNLGDSYATVGGASVPQSGAEFADRRRGSEVICRSKRMTRGAGRWGGGNAQACGTVKPKDLLMIPARAALALQADGWYLRSDIIWHKPNPMPESVTDRPTKSHEYLFLLTKSERYFYDAAAIAEPVSESMKLQMAQGYEGLGLKDYKGAGVQNPSSVKARIIANARLKAIERYDRGELGAASQMSSVVAEDGDRYMSGRVRAKHQMAQGETPTRNRRTVWTIPTMPYSGAHFATMPEALVEPCILAGSRFGDLVFDPFSGSGTVLAVAERLGRRGVGTDLNPAYHALAKVRTAQRGLRFEQETA